MSFGSITMLGMVGCEVVSQTVKAVALIPFVLATSPALMKADKTRMGRYVG